MPFLFALVVNWSHAPSFEPTHERLPLAARAHELQADLELHFSEVDLSTVIPGSVLSIAWYPLYAIHAVLEQHTAAVLARYQLDAAPSSTLGTPGGDPRPRLDPLCRGLHHPVAGLVMHLAFREGWLVSPPGTIGEIAH